MTDRELQRALLDRLGREPVAHEPRRRSFLDIAMTLLCIGLGLAILWLIVEPYIQPHALTIQPTLPTAFIAPAQNAPQAPPAPAYQQPAAAPQATPAVAPAVPIEAAPQAAPVEAQDAPQAPPPAASGAEPVALPAADAPGFKESFGYQSDVNPFVGCLPGRACNASLPGPTATLPQPGDPGFKDSFK